MLSDGPAGVLLGRSNECETLEHLLDVVRGGESGVLVLVGEPGIGKTALLEHTVASAAEFRVARGPGVESEMELAFSTLQQLCVPLLDGMARLPNHQGHALRVALGLDAGDPPDQFLVGIAALSLLADAAEERPLLCVIDDAHWLDQSSAQALGFVARRLVADSVGLVFATRESIRALRGLPELRVEGLRDLDARRLLGTAISGPLDEQVRDRFLAETHGNPLALLELPRGLDPAELAGGFGMPHLLPLAGRIEETFRLRLAELPAETQRLLLLAAADPVGDPLVLWRAAERLGIGVWAADAAEAAGLLEVGASIVFRHPLVRSSAYHGASPVERREVHRALAEAIDPDLDPDRRAWQRALATSGPSEEIASELERSAERARARGGLAATAAFLERAVALTIDPAIRAERALAGARANQEAGALAPALALLAAAESGPLDELSRARVEVARAEIAFASSRGPDTGRLLLSAAKRVEPLDLALAREIYLSALIAASARQLGENGGASEVARAARAAPAPTPPRAVDLLLDGVALATTEGLPAGAPILRDALAAFRGDGLSNEERLRWLGSASHVAELMWDYDAWDALSARAVEEARNQGALRALPVALTSRLGVHLFAGELDVATSVVEQVNTVTDAIGPYARVWRKTVALAGYRGDEAAAAKVFAAATAEFTSRGEAEGLTAVRWATAVLYNGLGRYEEALEAGVRAAAESHETWFARSGLVDLIEAAARSRDVNLARDALERLARNTSAAGTDWALAMEARSRALVNTGEAAEQLYRAAHEMFTDFGMQAFADRARTELSATGERARKRTVETRDDLTPQEANISRLVANGATNREIAGQLFISSSTVDYHLQKVFRKLGVRSRTQLAHHMLQRPERGGMTERQP